MVSALLLVLSNRSSCPGPHTSESLSVALLLLHPSPLDEKSAGSRGCAHQEFIPFPSSHNLSTQDYKIPCPNGPEPTPRIYMGLSPESRLPRVDHAVGMHTPRPKKWPRHSSLLEAMDKAWLYGLECPYM